jgi:hypothetical protein
MNTCDQKSLEIDLSLIDVKANLHFENFNVVGYFRSGFKDLLFVCCTEILEKALNS